MTDKKQGLELLREPFPENQILKLPKGSKAQNQCPDSEKINCLVCKGWHHPKVIHLDYVGHAALTDRLLDVDPLWSWEPLALKDGLPAFDESGGLWIKLTVCGHTRIGYGHAEKSNYKEIGSREKEVIGDALRNAAMRFGAALDLWHKGDLHNLGGGELSVEKISKTVTEKRKPSADNVNVYGLKNVQTKNTESDVSEVIGDNSLLDFQNSSPEDQCRTITVLSTAKKYDLKNQENLRGKLDTWKPDKRIELFKILSEMK
jgi:hypothetical protein